MEEPEVNRKAGKPNRIYISTVVSISLVLLMIGLLALIILHAKNLSTYVKENILFSVLVKEGTNEVDILQLQKEIELLEAVKSTQYVNQEAAAKSLTEELGGEDFIKFLGYNPLLSSIDVYLKAEYSNADSIAKIQEQLEQNEMVDEVYYQSSLVQFVDQNVRSISLVILAIGLIFLIVAVALINNTIRLSIYSQRFIIKSMQLVGATGSFIRKPFLVYGALHGLLAGLVAIILLIGLLYFAQKQVPELIILQSYFEFLLVFLFVIGSGVLISLVSTYFSVTKFLGIKTNELY